MTRQFHKHFSGAVLFKYFLWLALVPAILSFNGCGSVDENEKKADEKQEDRFAFLRRDEQKKVKARVENIEEELIKSKQPESVKLTTDTLKKLEGNELYSRYLQSFLRMVMHITLN